MLPTGISMSRHHVEFSLFLLTFLCLLGIALSKTSK